MTATRISIDAPVPSRDVSLQVTETQGHRVLFRALDSVAQAVTGKPGKLIRGHSHQTISHKLRKSIDLTPWRTRPQASNDAAA